MARLRQKFEAERKLKTSSTCPSRRLAARIHTLAMLMLAAPDQGGVVRVLEEQLRVSFHADQSVLVVFDDPAAGTASGRFLRVVGRDDPAIASFRTFLQANAPRCGQVRDAQRDYLFGAGKWRSVRALVQWATIRARSCLEAGIR